MLGDVSKCLILTKGVMHLTELDLVLPQPRVALACLFRPGLVSGTSQSPQVVVADPK